MSSRKSVLKHSTQKVDPTICEINTIIIPSVSNTVGSSYCLRSLRLTSSNPPCGATVWHYCAMVRNITLGGRILKKIFRLFHYVTPLKLVIGYVLGIGACIYRHAFTVAQPIPWYGACALVLTRLAPILISEKHV